MFSNFTGKTKLRRHECAAALCAHGFPITAKTLAAMATRGGGPPCKTWGRAVLYEWGEVLAWAEQRLRTRNCDA